MQESEQYCVKSTQLVNDIITATHEIDSESKLP